MEVKKPVLNYADEATPNDSRRARRFIALGIFLAIMLTVFVCCWVTWGPMPHGPGRY